MTSCLTRALAFVPLASLLPWAAQAEGRAEVMLDLMGRVPTERIEPMPQAWSGVEFADYRAAAAAVPQLPGDAPEPALALRLGIMAQGDWEPLAGFGPTDLEVGLRLGSSGAEQSMLLRLPPDVAARVAPALLASGYQKDMRAGVRALARGEDLEIDVARRNPADPFDAGLGMSSRVVVDGPWLVQSRTWPGLVALVGAPGDRRSRGHPDLVPMAEALDRPEWGEVALVEAVLPHQLDLGLVGGGGLPVWRLGLIADLSPPAEAAATGAEAVTLVLVSYAGRAEAEQAAARIADGWDESLALQDPLDSLFLSETTPAPGTVPTPPTVPSLAGVTGAEVETGVAGQGPFVVWAALRGPAALTPDLPGNLAFTRLRQAVYMRAVPLLGPP